MVNLKDLLEVLHESTELSTNEEIVKACKLIIEVQAFSYGEQDCIIASFEKGVLEDGDTPSKSSRDSLLEKGYMAKVISRGEWGFNACTYKGAWAYRLIQAQRGLNL